MLILQVVVVMMTVMLMEVVMETVVGVMLVVIKASANDQYWNPRATTDMSE